MSIVLYIIFLEINTKENNMSIQTILNNHGINSIWHFTDRSNLKSILEYGLLSLGAIVNNKIEVSRFGATHSSHIQDVKKGLHKFVHLSFIKDHPMYHMTKLDGRIIDPIWIEIDLSVMNEENTLFSNMLANTSNADIFNAENLEKKIDFDIILHEKDFYTRKEARKAEILVFDEISVDQIKGIYNGN